MIMSSGRHTLYIKDGKSLCHVTYLSACLLYMEGAEQTRKGNQREKKRRDKEARKGHEERKQIECRQVKEPRK